MAPNLWAKLSAGGRQRIQAVERAHGDGILVDNKSPEAFEEVFWRVVDDYSFVTPQGVFSHVPEANSLAEYRVYRDLVCRRYSRNRYLSKNNNNLFRLATLARDFSDDVFLIPFRDPPVHAQSLLDQHRRFSGGSSFVVNYMRWLGHFEFGDTHLHFMFDDPLSYQHAPTELDYWIEVWIRTYSFVLKILNQRLDNVIPVCYESLCENNPDFSRSLAEKCALDTLGSEFSRSTKTPSTDPVR